MGTNNLLRKQVVSEMKKRRLIFLTVILLGFLYLGISFFFGDMGLIKYTELNKRKANLEKQITEMDKDNEQFRTEIRLLKEDPFYLEKYGREEYGLARPDEYIFLYDDE